MTANSPRDTVRGEAAIDVGALRRRGLRVLMIS